MRKRPRPPVQEIQQLIPKRDVRSLVADLTSQAQVRTRAQAYRDAYPRLVVLNHNTGVLFGTRRLSVDGRR